MEEPKSKRVKFKLPDGKIIQTLNFDLDFIFENDKMKVINYKEGKIYIYQIDNHQKLKYYQICRIFNIPYKFL